MTSPSQLVLLYALPAFLTAVILFFVTWRNPPQPLRWELLLTGAFFGVGLYLLEGMWPWNAWPVVRSLHWLPFGAVALGGLSLVSARFPQVPVWIRLAVLSIGLTGACLATIRPYYLQLNPDASPEFHQRILLLVLCLLVLHACGAALLARRFPAIPVLIIIGVIHLGAIGFAIEAAASGKIGQLIGVSGVIIGGTFILHLIRAQKLLPEFAFLVAGLSGMSVIFSFYATSSTPPISSVVLWLLTPVIGFLWCMAKEDSERKSKIPLAIVTIWVLSALGASAFVVTYYHPRNQGEESEDSDNYHELYGRTKKQPAVNVDTNRLTLSDSTLNQP